MDRQIVGGLINSISRFILVVSCQSPKTAIVKDFSKIVATLKLLKPVLDEVVESRIPSDEQLTSAFEELDTNVNEARAIIEKSTQRISKIYSVLQNEPMVLKIQRSSIEICHVLSNLLQSSSFASQSASIQHCIQELQCAERVLTSQLVKNALKDQGDNVMPSYEDIIKITEALSLASNQELLMENIALEKERVKAELKKNSEDADHINQLIALVSYIRYQVAKQERFGFINGLHIPSYFRCPLSMELMMDPVILASGQTYERACIQKWLDSGLRTCPKTHQTLAHINLVPNYTVQALIANWCEENGIRLCDSIQPDRNTNPFLSTAACEDVITENSFHDLLHGDSTSRFSIGCPNETQQEKAHVASYFNGDVSCLVSHQQVNLDKLSAEGNISHKRQSSCHSRSESISSTISSVDISSKFDDKVRLLEDVTHPSSSPSYKDTSFSTCSSPYQLLSSKNGPNGNDLKSLSSVVTSEMNDVTTSLHVEKLVEDLRSQIPEVQRAAASEIRLFTKHNMENRVLIGKGGAISPLVFLLYSKVKKVQENAVTALLNLSIDDHNKSLIAEAGAIEPLIHVLEYGNMEAKENSAATLFSLSILEECKVKIGRSDAVRALVNLLASGSLRGKKDAATALFNLSIFHDNKVRIVKAGAVKHLVELLEPLTCMIDKSVALLANLATIPEGTSAIVQAGGIPLLVEILETGSQRGKENAASALLQLCINSKKFCSLVLQEGAVPPLIALSQFGTPRAREKAQQILSHFRSQRDGAKSRAKP